MNLQPFRTWFTMWSYKWIEKTKACPVLGQTSPACVDTALLTRPPNYGDGLSPVGGVWIHKKDLGLTATWLAQPILRPAPSRVATGHQHTKLVDQPTHPLSPAEQCKASPCWSHGKFGKKWTPECPSCKLHPHLSLLKAKRRPQRGQWWAPKT